MYLLLQITTSLNLPDRALLVQLFFQNDNSAIVAPQKSLNFEGIGNFPLTVKNIRIIIITKLKKEFD